MIAEVEGILAEIQGEDRQIESVKMLVTQLSKDRWGGQLVKL